MGMRYSLQRRQHHSRLSLGTLGQSVIGVSLRTCQVVETTDSCTKGLGAWAMRAG
jgi:hypothetical protein